MLSVKFHRYKEGTHPLSLPENFTYPFNYTPHPLAELAANELQEYLRSQQQWSHNFGFDEKLEGKVTGKMFGVLVVQKSNGELGHLWAYSGKLAGKNDHPEFVPPIFNMLDEEGFFRIGERELTAINEEVDQLYHTKEYTTAKEAYLSKKASSEVQLEELRKVLREKKRSRDKIRAENPDKQVLEKLANESMSDHFLLKEAKTKLTLKIDEAREKLQEFESRIEALKDLRRKKSADLQRQLFESYDLKNAFGQEKKLVEIFDEFGVPTPSGAGECAAPKLLQYAYENKLKPIALAEFWWGNPPQKEVRKHGQFYPSCKSKCEPILGHMMKGLNVEVNPILEDPDNFELDIIHEDDSIIVINKQSGLLSVPGKTKRRNVLDLALETFKDLEGPVIVHRLDMSTSGIMILAKNERAYHSLQDQFASRTVKKRYAAELSGVLNETKGTIDLPLRVDLDNRPRQLVCFEYGKKALTHWKVLEVKNGNTLVHFFPETGRTHQLRVHASHQSGLNAPIIGDELYGLKGKRLHLHAEYIQFIHPEHGKKVSFQVKAPFC